MGLKIVKFIFFGNYFIGLLAMALTVESTLQLHLPFNSIPYYILITVAPVVYYTYAYMGVNKLTRTTNPRAQWYISHQTFIKWSQLVLSLISLTALFYLLGSNVNAVLSLAPKLLDRSYAHPSCGLTLLWSASILLFQPEPSQHRLAQAFYHRFCVGLYGKPPPIDCTQNRIRN